MLERSFKFRTFIEMLRSGVPSLCGNALVALEAWGYCEVTFGEVLKENCSLAFLSITQEEIGTKTDHENLNFNSFRYLLLDRIMRVIERNQKGHFQIPNAFSCLPNLGAMLISIQLEVPNLQQNAHSQPS